MFSKKIDARVRYMLSEVEVLEALDVCKVVMYEGYIEVDAVDAK